MAKKETEATGISVSLGMEETKNLIKLAFKQFIDFKEKGINVTGARPIPLCLWGVKGIGKTTIVKTAAKELSEELGIAVNVVSRQLSVAQPFDIGGYPHISTEKIGGKTINLQRFAVPEFLVDHAPNAYTFLFLDEINRARPEMHNAVMGLLDGRGSNEHPMPQNMFVISAANPNSDDYGATTGIDDEAILDRMIHVNVQTKKSETLEFLKLDKTIDDAVFRFLNEDEDRIPAKKFDSITDTIKPSDRGYCHLGRILPFLVDARGTNKRLIEAVAKGLIGTTAGELFVDRMAQFYQSIKAEDVLNNFNAALSKTLKGLVNPDEKGVNRLDEVNKVNNELKILINVKNRKEYTTKQLTNLKKYLYIVPQDQREDILTANFKETELAELRGVISETMSKESLDVRSLNFR